MEKGVDQYIYFISGLVRIWKGQMLSLLEIVLGLWVERRGQGGLKCLDGAPPEMAS